MAKKKTRGAKKLPKKPPQKTPPAGGPPRKPPKKRRAPKEPAARPRGGYRVLHLVRHGEYVQEGPYDVLGGPLTPLGRRQARLAGRYLRDFPIEVVHTSDMVRARETAALVSEQLPGVPVKVSSLLRECSIAPIPGRRWGPKDAKKALARFDQIWKHFIVPCTRTRHEAVVCHGNLIRSIVVKSLQVKPLTAWTKIHTYNCAITKIGVIPDGSVVIATVNDIAHIPTEMRT